MEIKRTPNSAFVLVVGGFHGEDIPQELYQNGQISYGKGRKATEETKKKMSEAQKGKKPSRPFQKGQPPAPHKKRCQCFRCTGISWNKGKKGLIKMSDERKKENAVWVKEHLCENCKMLKSENKEHICLTKKEKSEKQKANRPKGYTNSGSYQEGHDFTPEELEKMSKARIGKNTGEDHHNWKGGISPLANKIRGCFESRLWIKQVFKRDNYTCQICSKRGNLNANHIIKFSVIIKQNNIKTLEEAIKCQELFDINNGITLCKSCHFDIVTYHEEEWESYFNFNLMTRGFIEDSADFYKFS